MPVSCDISSPHSVPDQDTTAALSKSLHQLAQPLTVLQGILELASIEARSTNEFHRYLHRASEQLHEVISCYGQTRELLHVSGPIPEANYCSLRAVLQELVRGLRGILQSSGLELLLHPPAVVDREGVLGDFVGVSRTRVHLALSLLFSRLLFSMTKGDKMEILLETCASQVRIRIAASSPTPLDAAPLRDSLAQQALENIGAVLEPGQTESQLLVSLPRAVPADHVRVQHA